MNAAPADQLRLVEIADLDAQLRAAEHARNNPPQAARVKELIAERSVLSQELTTRQGAVDDLAAEVARIEADVQVVRARLTRDEGLLQQVSNPKDAAGLEHEIASLQRRQRELEDSELELMERREEAEAAVAEQRALVDAAQSEGATLSTEAKQLVADATTRIDALTRDRAAVATTVPADLLALYDRLATRSAGAAILRARTCTGCHMLLSGTGLATIRAAAEDLVVNCPECGCILVRTDDSGL